jgi:putative membrane protein insertion efficiency factor
MGARPAGPPEALRRRARHECIETAGNGPMTLAPAQSQPHLRPSMLARGLIGLIRLYQLILSPWLGRVCRFEPSCSRYAVACLETQGAARGSLLSVKRLCKCHPFHPGGYDPPPSESRL